MADQGRTAAFAQSGRPMRLLTTTYTGATDAEAVEAIARLPNARLARRPPDAPPREGVGL